MIEVLSGLNDFCYDSLFFVVILLIFYKLMLVF